MAYLLSYVLTLCFLLNVENTKGATLFTRWGSTKCPEKTELYYSGYTAGGHYNHKGSGANHLCLPKEVQYNTDKNYNGANWGYLAGTEYQPNTKTSTLNKEVPCAVCIATEFATGIMIPGKMSCLNGWSMAYTGELQSGHYGHATSTEFICVDKGFETIGNVADKNGCLLYPVKYVCGSLACPPYQDKTLVTCVYCLK